jgi:hypothetical protein
VQFPPFAEGGRKGGATCGFKIAELDLELRGPGEFSARVRLECRRSPLPTCSAIKGC